MELKNRMVMAPMGVTVGNLSPASVAYFAARAEGGAAGRLGDALLSG